MTELVNGFKSPSGFYAFYERKSVNDEWELKISTEFDPDELFDETLRSAVTGYVPVDMVKDGKVDIEAVQKIFHKPL